ncbi:M48 family metalloprotease [Rhodocista pekingensis]|uniref:M48 family metalloprotease n=1 Tax=Rhodocista pekingensis TaxID=201185 RepID=A0ABW2KRU9_9PROT
MGPYPKRLAYAAVAWVVSVLLAVQPAMAQRQLSFIRDAEIEHILKAYTTPLFKASGIIPEAVTIGLIKDDSLNAFVAGGQNIFVHTGLLMESTDASQVIGVLAHETGHIAGGHLARSRDAIEDASTVASLAMLLGLAAAIGSGRGDVGTGVIAGGQELARRTFFSFSRTQEGSADEFAMSTLEKIGWSSRGLLAFMEKLASQELVPESRQVEYVRTHPLTRNRIEVIKHFVERESKHSDSPLPAEFTEMHARMKAKLVGFLRPDLALRRYTEADRSVAGRYGRAIGLYQKGEIGKALEILDGLLAAEPTNPYFHELRGQILFENGRAAEAVPSYRRAVELLPESGLLRSALAHALLEVQDDRLLDEAIANLQAAALKERYSSFIWRLLASAYSRADNQPLLAYSMAEEALARGDVRAAKFHADRAEQLLPAGSPEWIRAQDIRVMVDSRPTDRNG